MSNSYRSTVGLLLRLQCSASFQAMDVVSVQSKEGRWLSAGQQSHDDGPMLRQRLSLAGTCLQGEERAQIYIKVALDLVFSCLLGTLSFEVVRACILDLSLLSGSEAVIVNLSGTALTSQ